MSLKVEKLSLAERLEQLEEIDEIKQLKYRYAAACDEGYDADRLVEMFTDDAVWDGEMFGTYRGKAELRRFYQGISQQITWAQHYMLNPVITIDPGGTTAFGTWNLLVLCTMTRANGSGSDAVLIAAQYWDRYVKRDGRWLNKHVKVHFHCVTNLDQGWVQQPFRR